MIRGKAKMWQKQRGGGTHLPAFHKCLPMCLILKEGASGLRKPFTPAIYLRSKNPGSCCMLSFEHFHEKQDGIDLKDSNRR